MKFSCLRLGFVVVLLLPTFLWANSKEQKQEKEAPGKKVDAGSFGVFVNGRRIGTETFSISESGNGSFIQSEFKTEGTAPEAAQTSELQLTSAGDIRRYEWKELSPGKGQFTVLPNDDFLTEKWTESPQDKTREQPFLLPPSTSILDDYFFVHREVLAWKFLAASCKQEGGQIKCPLKQRTKFGSLNPRQRLSAPISMEFVGREKVSVHGSEQELIKLQLDSNAGEWDLWLNDQLMLQKIAIPSERTEVVRD